MNTVGGVMVVVVVVSESDSAPTCNLLGRIYLTEPSLGAAAVVVYWRQLIYYIIKLDNQRLTSISFFSFRGLGNLVP